MKKYKPIILIILDGWGISPSWGGNALAVNQPKNINRLWRDYPHKVLQAFTLVAGKYGIVGDSRLGHSTIAAGRRIPQDLEIISESIAKNEFYSNKVLVEAVEHARKHQSNLHLVGLISNGGVHSHLAHLQALLELCFRRNFERVFIDAFTDGIDSGQSDALSFIGKVKEKILEVGLGKFSSICGRIYAMDRIGDFGKTNKCYDLLTQGKAKKAKANSIMEAIAQSYRQKQNDFNLEPQQIENEGKTTPINDNDAVIFFNFRADRSTQLLKMFFGLRRRKLFFKPKVLKNLFIVTFTKYDKNLPAKVAFPPLKIKDTLGEVLAKYQQDQLRLSEEEKGAHVTSFFNCGRLEPFPAETRKIIPSRQTDDQTKNPAMATPKITQTAIAAIKSHTYDFILINLANVDMISHTGNISAAGLAIQTVDRAVQDIIKVSLSVGGATIITADHGNIEQMVKLKPEQDPETKHTLNPVPFILVTKDNKKNLLKSALSSPYFSLAKIITAKETLADIAPTILELMEIPKPGLMTGHSLLNRLE